MKHEKKSITKNEKKSIMYVRDNNFWNSIQNSIFFSIPKITKKWKFKKLLFFIIFIFLYNLII